MFRALFLPFILFLIPRLCFASQPIAKQGYLDISHFDYQESARLKLNGEWKFYEGTFLNSDSIREGILQPHFIKVPYSWDELRSIQGISQGTGFGTYRLGIQLDKGRYQSLLITDVGSCYKIWVNGQLLKEVGKIGKSKESCEPRYKYIDLTLPSDTNFLDLVVEVANFHQVKGGLRTHFTLIQSSQLKLYHERNSILQYACLGIIFIIGLYHLGLFVLNQTDNASLNFGLFCFDIFLFLAFRRRIVHFFYMDIDWEISNRIEYISQFISLPLFYNFFYRSFPNQFKKIFYLIAIVVPLILTAIVWFSNTLFFSKTLAVFHLVLLLYVVVVLLGLSKALLSKQPGARVILVGFFIFMVTLVNDILHVQNIIDTGNYVIIGILGFIVCQAYFLAYRSVQDQFHIKKLYVDLNFLNSSLERFVPADFMQLLKRKNITEVNLGNFIEKEMTIMFSDIRSFTAISEKLTAEASFAFINDYLQIMGPIIRKHNGFIDKYIGDGIMALFPGNPNDAILCSQEMMEVLHSFNIQNAQSGKPQIEIGIGLHTGTCILGTVGEPRRMDTTVISDAVNLAARIESLTKHYQTPVIISAETYKRTDEKLKKLVRYIGTARVKGKTIHTDLYKVFWGLHIDFNLLDLFDQAIAYYLEKEFEKAKALFIQLSNTQLNDGVLQLYLNRCKEYEKNGIPDDWQTFEVFEY